MPKNKMTNTTFLGSFEGLIGENGEVIYTITSITPRNNERPISERRCWGWYKAKEEAYKAVRINAGDMHETTYTHVVVEEVPSGIPAISKDIRWYSYVRNEVYTKGRWVKCKKPEWSEQIVNYSLG